MLASVLLVLATARVPEDNEYRAAALEVGRWLEAQAIEEESGKLWPIDPDNPLIRPLHLYSGTPGVVLFFLELADATGDDRWLELASAGADALIARLPKMWDDTGGLYVGLAGTAFTLEETSRSTEQPRFHEAALKIVERLHEAAKVCGNGVEWNSTSDIVGGGAGTGLFLLWAARELKHPASLELAKKAGLRLIELGQPVGEHLKWPMDPSFPREMPNFSHGTAGVAFFLARLYEVTAIKPFLDAARRGAGYLDSIANRTEDGYLVHHSEPGNEELYYLGWCHGPVGTSRLFEQLALATSDGQYLDRVHAGARSILTSGIPEQETPGFWNNVSVCCGSAGVADFFLLQAQNRGDPSRYAGFARRMLDDLLRRGERDAQGLRWTQAEHRVRPELLLAQTGYSQGAAGVGMVLLHMDGALEGRAPRIVLPDTAPRRGAWKVLEFDPADPVDDAGKLPTREDKLPR